MPEATLTVTSRNYGSWSLRGFLLCRLAGIDVDVRVLSPAEEAARAHCRSVCGEMHSGFANLRAALPMNLRAHHPGFRVVTAAQADVDRIAAIWRDCLARHGGPFLFGAEPGAADAMYAPVCARFATYDVALDEPCAAYCDAVLALEAMVEWTTAARAEPDEIEELEIEF